MGVGHEHDGKHVFVVRECFDVTRTDLLQSWNQKIVSVDEQLQEEFDALLADVEVVRVEVLDDAVEENLWDTVHLDQFEGILALLLVLFLGNFFEAVGPVKHGSEVFTPSSQHHRVALDVALVLKIEDDVEELI